MVKKLVEKHESKVQRTLEIIPGLLTWLFILSPVWLGILYPPAFSFLIIFVAVYWAYLAVKGTVGGFVGYRKYKSELQTDWMQKCQELNFTKLPEQKTLPPSLFETKHMILIPVVNESKEILKPSIDAIFNQTVPTNQITLVYTAEEKYKEQVKTSILEILGTRINDLDEFMFFVHPAGIVGEAIGVAGANRTWGGKHAVEQLKKQNKPIRNYIFTTIDSDHVMHEQYLARLTHLYLTSDKRDNRFYSSAVHTFNNNNWRVPMMMRMEANFVTLGTLTNWALSNKDGEQKDTFAAYSISLKTLIDADYWDPQLGIDDTVFYWRAFFARQGDFTGVSHFIPISGDAVEGKSFVNSHTSMYKQLLRWGYGVVDFPLSIKGFMTHSEIPLSKKISWILKHLHKRVLLVNMVFLLTFGFAIATFINPYFRQTTYAYTVPNIVSVILTITLLFLIPGMYLRAKMAKPMPETWPLWRKMLAFLEGPLVLFNLLTYSFIPFVDAQTRMMFGKRMKDLYHTPKVRKPIKNDTKNEGV